MLSAGSAGTAVDSFRDEILSTSQCTSAAAVHRLSRPRTVRHKLTPPPVGSSSPSHFTTPNFVSAHSSGVGSLAAAAAAPPHAAARGTTLSGGFGKKTGGDKITQCSLELKGDRYCKLLLCCLVFVSHHRLATCRLLSWLREANEGEGGGLTPLARFMVQLKV